MTAPNFDFLKPAAPATQDTPSGGPNFDFLKNPDAPPPIPQEDGFFARVGNTMNNLWKLHQLTQGTASTETLEEIAKTNIADGDTALHTAIQDVKNLFGKFNEDPSGAIDATIEQAKKIRVMDVIAGIPEGFLGMLTSPISSITGLGLSKEKLYGLTPEERAHEIKVTAGNVVAVAVSMGVGAGIGAALRGVESAAITSAAAEEGTIALAQIARNAPLGKLARQITKGTLEAGAFGGTQSAVAYANEDQQFTQMLMNGVLFAPLGAALEVWRGHDPLGPTPGRKAYDILKTRQIQMIDDFSLSDVTGFVESFKTADDLDAAIISGKMITPKDVVMIDGIDIGRNTKLEKGLNKTRAEYFKKLDESDVMMKSLRERYLNKEISLEEYESLIEKFQAFRGNPVPPNEYDIISTKEFGRADLKDLEYWTGVLENEFSTLAETRKAFETWGKKNPDKLGNKYLTTSFFDIEIAAVQRNIRSIEAKINYFEAKRKAKPRTLIVGKDSGISSDAKDFFGDFGFLPREVVSYEGKDFIVTQDLSKPDQNKLVLENPTSGQIIKNPDHTKIRVKSSGVAQSEWASFDSPLTLKGRYLQEARLAGQISKGDGYLDFQSSFEKQNNRALAQAETGKPITLIGFRQQRGIVPVDKAGVFYGKGGSSSRFYSPRSSYNNRDVMTPAGKRQSLVLHKLEFQNPFVVEYGDQGTMSGHYGLLKELQGKGGKNITLTTTEARQLKEAYAITQKTTGSQSTHDPYHLVDRVIAKVLTDRGYDGIIYQGGDQIVDLRGRVALDVKQKVTGRILGEASQDAFRASVYNDFKNELLSDANKEYAKVPKDARELIGFDDKPPDNIANVAPTKPFNDLVEDYMKRKGLDPATRDFVLRDFEHRLHGELMAGVPSEDLNTIRRLAKEAETLREQESLYRHAERKASVEDLVKSANSNGMYVDVEDSGNFVLRDAETDKILGRFNKNSDAQRFINESGQAKGIELDGGGSNGLPPRMFGELQPNPDGPLKPNQIPFIGRDDGWMGNITSSFNSIADWLTPNREIMIAMDNKFGTKLFSRVYDTTQVARAKANAAIMPWYNRLSAIEKIDKRMSKGERDVVGGWLETMSLQEVMERGGRGGKALKPEEIEFGKKLVATNGDLQKAFKYNRQLKEVAEEYQNRPDDLVTATQELQKAMFMSPEDMAAAAMIDNMTRQSTASIGPSVRYARTVQQGGGMTRAEYAKFHKMDPKHVAMGQQLESLFQQLAPEFGIAPENMMANYMTHARLYAKGNITEGLNFFDFGDAQGNKEFYAKMVRTGEIDAYETDPIRAAQRYIKAGFDAKLMQETLDNAKKALKEELLKVPDDAREKFKRVTERYLSDLQGSPGPASKFTQNVVDKMLDKLGIEASIDVRKNIINTISATGEAAAQGFRIVAGIRDFYTGVSLYYARFGTVRTARMLRMGAVGLENVTRQSLAEGGIIPTLSQVAFDTPTEFTSTVLGRSTGMVGDILRKTGEVGLKLSGQKDVYALLHAGSYLDTWSLVGEQLRKLNKGEITKAQAYKKLSIESYHQPVVQAFDSLVSAGKFDEAAQMLARATGAEQVGIFGLGNNPGGWNRNIGRIAGQFGSWSMWYRAHMMQMVSRGSYGYRAASVARLAASQAVLAGVSAATGISFASWYTTPALLFGGGPIVDAYETVNDAVAGYGPEQKLAQGRLRRFLPYDPGTGQFNINQIYVPGSFFANDLSRAYQLARQGGSIPSVVASAAGFRFQK